MSSNICQVCSKQSHGLHFGAITCRACAAYFRRAILKKYEQLECTNGDEKCEKYSELCKKCRLEKCVEVGMTDKRLQLGRDPMSSTVKPCSLQQFVGRPSFILSCDPATEEKSSIDFTKLLENASIILSSSSKCYVGMNMLNRLSNSLSSDSDTPKRINRIGKNELLELWEDGFLRVAEWFSNCDKFQELPVNMRIEFLKIVWMTCSILQKDVKTANHRINKINQKTEQEGFVSENCVVNIKNLEVDLSWFSEVNFIKPIEEHFSSIIIDTLMTFRPTSQETTYMLAVFSFRLAAKTLGKDFEVLCENVIHLLADELHFYYTDELKLKQYASRITQMMKIVNIVERNHYEKMERFELARMFRAIRVDFSHPELIYGRR